MTHTSPHRRSRRRQLAVLVAATVAFGASASGQAPSPVLDRVATFAKLYGVVRYFYPSEAAVSVDWDRLAVYGVRQVRGAADRRALETTLETLMSALGPGIEIGDALPPPPQPASAGQALMAWRYLGPGISPPGTSVYRRARLRFSHESPPVTTGPMGPPPTAGAHVDVDLGSGLKARVALALAESEAATAPAAALDTLRLALAALTGPGDVPDVDWRLADAVVAWNVFRHFYPYWPETGVDWDARLRPHLEGAFTATTRQSHRDALRQLVADARDGHGLVIDPAETQPRALLPIRLRFVDNTVVVSASDQPTDAPVGAMVSTIDGAPALAKVESAMRLASGTPQWRRARALKEVTGCDKGALVTLGVDSGQGPRTVGLPCESTQPPSEPRPAPVTELMPGIWYVDLTRATMATVSPRLPGLATADGVIFDVRGYPTDAGAAILPHLVSAPESDRWMHIAQIVGPFGQTAGWQSLGWNLKPSTPTLSGKIAFLTDGRAISYAESVMGYVADQRLGTIVGSTTAGTNGNVVRFAVPSGLMISFTGMRVTKHDGRTPFHLSGVTPDVDVSPTLAGLRSGRDEVLDRAVAVVRGK